jgi:vesicle-associated membrane protein 72
LIFLCRSVIKQHVQYVLDHSDEIDKTLKLQAQV